jgi:hypothetical protein
MTEILCRFCREGQHSKYGCVDTSFPNAGLPVECTCEECWPPPEDEEPEVLF